MADEIDVGAIRVDLARICRAGAEYFKGLKTTDPAQRAREHGTPYSDNWNSVPLEYKEAQAKLAERLKPLILKIIEACKASPLTDESDVRDLRFAMKRMSAALRLKLYYSADTEVIHNEGEVLGVRQSYQEERSGNIEDACSFFTGSCDDVSRILDLVSAPEGKIRPALPSEAASVSKHRLNTAFIMMMMDKSRPELEDVHNCIKEAFGEFKIRAIRSDDIEHQDVITNRILGEIATSEFLIADLTGERPSVYYEVGYAHAIGKRPILFRKKETPLHFDLAVHNVPEYDNITDLRSKLRRRLAALTNKEITTGE